MSTINLYDFQLDAIEKLRSGSILCGGVGSGKSITSLAFYLTKICFGYIDFTGRNQSPMLTPHDLYIITTARKRDSLEWDKEASKFSLSKKREDSIGNVQVSIDSWNNIAKYTNIKDAFFIFDEQRIVGNGSWVKSFITITRKNKWILLSATPGDTWIDYVPVFLANNYYRNRTEFIKRHVVYSPFTNFPKIEKYLDTGHLNNLLKNTLVTMDYTKPTISHNEFVLVNYDKHAYNVVVKDRWNIETDTPIQNATELCLLLRKIVNSDESRTEQISRIKNLHPRIIVFYNFDYELKILREYCKKNNHTLAEWNGHKHEDIPESDEWTYLVQYTAGAEGWNCTKTNAIIFYSQNYSYRTTVQAAGRIDRLNTKYKDLYYYHLISNSSIDAAIQKTLKKKKNFNARNFKF